MISRSISGDAVCQCVECSEWSVSGVLMVESVVCKRHNGACGGVDHRCSLQLSESMTSVTARSRCCVKRTCVGALCVECS